MPARHILFFTPAFPPFPGGGERYTAALAAHLAARGHHLSVLTSKARQEADFWQGQSGQVTDFPSTPNLDVIRCDLRPFPGGRRGLLAWRKAMVLLSSLPGSQRKLLSRMARAIPPVLGLMEAAAELGKNFDLVHAFNISWEYPLLAARQYASQHRLPYVITPFAHLGAHPRDRVALNSTMDHQRRLMSSADALLTLTSIETEGLLRRGVNAPYMIDVGAGYDPLPTAPATAAAAIDTLAGRSIGTPFVLFIGRCSFEKGAIHAAQAVIGLMAVEPDLTLVLVGQQTDEFQSYYNDLSAQEKQAIRPLGLLPEEEKHTLLDNALVLTLPSRTDSFGIVLLEAWAHGKPVIGANAGGIPAVIDEGENGLLVDFGNVPALSKAIHSLLVDQELSRRMGANGQEKVKRQYNWEQVTDRVTDVYESVLS